jgi:hypothetical protein
MRYIIASTTQFQCQTSANSTPGFSVSSSGRLLYQGGEQFVACHTDENGGLSIYTNPPLAEVSGCVDIILEASSCGRQQTLDKGCPENLSGSYQFPHLIIPINCTSPNTTYGTQYSATVSSTVSSIFNFDIPASYSGQTCSLIFLFPNKQDLQTSSYTFSGDGKIDFSLLSGIADQSTDYANAPGVQTDYGVTTVAPGNSYSIASFGCPAGKAVSFELENAGTTNLTYFQDYGAPP